MLKKLGSMFMLLVLLSLCMVACTPSSSTPAPKTADSMDGQTKKIKVSRRSFGDVGIPSF